MAMARKRRGRRRRRFEQSVPLVLGRRAATRPVTLGPIQVLGGLGAVAVLGLILWVACSPRFYVMGAQVIGASRIPEGTILAASGLERLHILWVNGRKAEAQILAQLPSVEQAEVSCRIPADCTIAIVEREPLLTWETEKGLLWVDAAGGALPASQPLEEQWLVSGPLPTDERGLVDKEVLIGLVELGRLGVQPGRIAYRSGRGLVLDDAAGWRVILGQGAGMEQRLQVYAAVRAHLLAHDIHPRFVDVRFPEAPYYSETNEW
ncbi:MAG TPA: FtsQ-type POTRA domain-containing protein [Chloroflexi bacterium]|nr:FtsQ-type POTRA domain-containing protein [Chloroflexota bacterium]